MEGQIQPRAHDVSGSVILPYNAHVAVVEIDDPIDDPYQRLSRPRSIAVKNLRDDPLGRLHLRGLDTARYEAGRDYQRAHEAAQINPVKAMDTTKDPVDGGGARPDPFTDKQRRADGDLQRLRKAVQVKWGWDGVQLMHSVLVDRKFMRDICLMRGSPVEERFLRGFAFIFERCLEEMAIAQGYAQRLPPPD